MLYKSSRFSGFKRRRTRAEMFVYGALYFLLLIFCGVCWWAVFDAAGWVMDHTMRVLHG
ncbi:hypothetical protein [Candidatus Nitrotoga sp. M5]|uniref:hypothetical protein n=1 Tax=Candidatus Nitrotoga sp. M5 TaxID=2890409 RepID=UPI001EF72829|nr:hypothetical protein [Candidatus Nitrotoga sp. M5]CAH1387044.1 hypothetical protein NTGM5_480040 [Candidatus Nitrotoga sp. M5]